MVIEIQNLGIISSLDILGITRYQEINGEHYIDLTTTRELKRGDLVAVTSDIDGITREYVVWSVSEPHEQDLIARTYRCVWSLQGILSTVTSSAMPSNKTARQALTSLLADTDAIAIGTVEPTQTASASFWRMTAWEGLAILVDTWGGEVDYTYNNGTRTINLVNHIGRTGAFTFYYGSSEINKITRTMKDGANVCRVIPLGAAQETDSGGYGRKIDITSVNNNKAYLEDAQEAAKYANAPVRYPTAYIENSEITDPAELKAWAQTVLQTITRPQPEYAVELVETYAPIADYIPALGDEGTIIDTDLGAELTARVYAITVDELAGSVKAVCSTSGTGLGTLTKLLEGSGLNATTGGTGTTSSSLLMTTTKSPYTSGITAYDRSVYGHNTFWRPGGNLVIGAGEFADNMRTADVANCYSGTGENLHLGADGTVYLYSNANTIGGRKTWTLGTDGHTTLPQPLRVNQGGTGATNAADAWAALGGGSIGKKNSLAADDIPPIGADKITSGTLPINRGGTNSTGVTQTTTIADIITASSGANISAASYSQWGKVAQLVVTFNAKSALANFDTLEIGTVVSGKRPKVFTGSSNISVANQISTAGLITVRNISGSTQSTTANRTVSLIYLLP